MTSLAGVARPVALLALGSHALHVVFDELEHVVSGRAVSFAQTSRQRQHISLAVTEMQFQGPDDD